MNLPVETKHTFFDTDPLNCFGYDHFAWCLVEKEFGAQKINPDLVAGLQIHPLFLPLSSILSYLPYYYHQTITQPPKWNLFEHGSYGHLKKQRTFRADVRTSGGIALAFQKG